MKNSISLTSAAAMIPDRTTLMIGGFMGAGSRRRLIDAIIAAGNRDLTVIANDTARRDAAVGKMIAVQPELRGKQNEDRCRRHCRRFAFKVKRARMTSL